MKKLFLAALMFIGLTSQVIAQITGPGGAGVPGGTPNQVQYNNAGAFGGFTVGGDGTLPAGTGLLNVTSLNGKAVTLAGALTTVGAFATTLTTTGATALTLPTAGTLAITSANTFTGIQTLPAGSAAAPSMTLGDATTGLYRSALNQWGLAVNGAIGYIFTGTDTTIPDGKINFGAATGANIGRTSGQNIGFYSGATAYASIGINGIIIENTDNLSWAVTPANLTGNTFIGRAGAANIRQGDIDAAVPVAQTFSTQSVIAGTSNTAGVNRIFAGSQGTGTGIGGSILFQVAKSGISGTAQNPLATGLTIDGTTGYPILPATTTVALLPACNAAARGALGQVSDATAPTYNAALTGGGAVFVPVYCNGTAWTSH